VSCDPTMFTVTLTSDPACNTFPAGSPTAFLLNIFSTAVSPWPSIEISLEDAKTLAGSIPKIEAATVCIFLPNTTA
jgi:hypothetical protein